MGKNDFEISIKNCRNIESVDGGGPITIRKNKLNVLYGRNGTGMTAKEKAQWLSWHTVHPALRGTGVCPYCGNEDDARLDACLEYDESRSNTEVKQWASIADMYDDLGNKLSRGNRALLGRVLNSKAPPSAAEVDELSSIAAEAAEAVEALENLSSMLRDEGSITGTRWALTGTACRCSFDGDDFDQVPFYVMEWCDEVAAKAAMK